MRLSVVVPIVPLLLGVADVATPQQPAVTYIDTVQASAALAGGGRLASGKSFSASGARRTGPGKIEVHDKETDLFYIIDGTATLVTGGTMIGGTLVQPDQWQGTDILGGEVHHLKKGDFIAIPPGTPHWFKDVPVQINYLMVKVRP